MKSKIQLHLRENNKESQKHLEQNAERFSRQSLKILLLMYAGRRLTTMNAPSLGILSLPRRIKDLRDRNGIHVDEHWLLDKKGKKIIKQWFINMQTKRATKKQIIDEWKKRLKKLNTKRN